MFMVDEDTKNGAIRRERANAFPDKHRSWFDFRIRMTEQGWKESRAPAKEGQQLLKSWLGTKVSRLFIRLIF
jgi:hypothetical protein